MNKFSIAPELLDKTANKKELILMEYNLQGHLILL